MRLPRFLIVLAAATAATASGQTPGASWFFAVSGDSRDCGDVIMPKIAHAIESRQPRAPVEFYWHLGDFRRMGSVDCDIAKRGDPSYDCRDRPKADPDDIARYNAAAWSDFLERQIAPFGKLPVFLGIGNHELYGGHTREQYRQTFARWLTQEPIEGQAGETWYHWVKNGVDFIALDNAEGSAFPPDEVVWLARILAADANNDAIHTIAVGLHAALPFSKSRNHAMDSTCAGRCSGSQVYDMLYRAQKLGAAHDKRKKVYVFASHSHFFEQNVYDTPEHAGQVLPGWIIGTAGAEHYGDTIDYGYLEVEARPDGTLLPRFREVDRETPPLLSGPEAQLLTDYCFTKNKRSHAGDDEWKGDCACGAVR